jgi:1,4-alpha-glucan branching enzyme
MPAALGSNAIVLHGHLPWIHHPAYEDFLEEDWYFEALAETYLPILAMLDGLREDRIPARLSVGLTPPLLEMFRAESLRLKADRFLLRRRELAEQEVARLKDDEEFAGTALHYLKRFQALWDLWTSKGRDLIEAFRSHQDEGRIEILASCATHAVLPLVHTREAQRAQIQLGMALYEECFGRPAQGFWLPECAYAESLDPLLSEAGIRYVILESHGVRSAFPTPKSGIYRPIKSASGVAAFGRDPESSRQVWAAEIGYPGDPLYRELYRDLGYDGDYEAVRGFLHQDGVRRNLGVKYHRITGKVALHDKQPYNVQEAKDKSAVHAGHYLWSRGEQIKGLAEKLGEAPCVLSPYDMELYGHWWYEAPWFLNALFRQMNDPTRRPPVRMVTPSQVLREPGSISTATPILSTWGEGGYLKVWLNEKNSWVLRHQQEAERRMIERARENPSPDARTERILDQMLRELFLLQASDWAFILTKETTVHYAKKRITDHTHRFLKLEQALKDENALSDQDLDALCQEDSLFPGLDFRLILGGKATKANKKLGQPQIRS